jgi:hypothetical protein
MGQAERVRFGQIVRARREELGLRQEEVTELGGPSDTTQGRIENASGPVPNVSTRNMLDAPLGWAAGSAARVWAGGEPEVAALSAEGKKKPTRRTPEVLVMGPDEVPVSLERLAGLLHAVTAMQRIVDADSEPTRADVNIVAEQLKGFVSQITGMWVTEMLERNAGPGRSVHPIIDFAFGEHLAIPVAEDDLDAEEKLYRRWLAHRGDGIGPDLQAKFQRRLRRRKGEFA